MKVGENGIMVEKVWLTEAELLGITAVLHIQEQIDLSGVPTGELANLDQVLASLRDKAVGALCHFG